jgi:hypothetical protein
MRAYSADLRVRVLADCDERRRRQTGSIACANVCQHALGQGLPSISRCSIIVMSDALEDRLPLSHSGGENLAGGLPIVDMPMKLQGIDCL